MALYGKQDKGLDTFSLVLASVHLGISGLKTAVSWLPAMGFGLVETLAGVMILWKQMKHGFGLNSMAGIGFTLVGAGFTLQGLNDLLGFSLGVAPLMLTGTGAVLALVDATIQ